MKSFASLLLSVLTKWGKSWLPLVMRTLGISAVVITGFTMFFDYYKLRAIAGLDSLGPVTGIMALAGVDKAISVAIGVRLAVAYFVAMTQPIIFIPNKYKGG